MKSTINMKSKELLKPKMNKNTMNLYEQIQKEKKLFAKVLDLKNRLYEIWENASQKEKSQLWILKDKVDNDAWICYRIIRALSWKVQEQSGTLDDYSYYWEDYNQETELKELKEICQIK